ncbi:MAG: DEAD/DEAH box helicase [Planctomycetia bacterium]|nr:DEAD/DEAH box helicase [Planctomycetia bacterium]
MSEPRLDLTPAVRSTTFEPSNDSSGMSLLLVPTVTTLACCVPKIGVASLPIRADKLKVRSFYFPQSGNWREKFLAAQAAAQGGLQGKPSAEASAAEAAKKIASAMPKSSTHIAPPKDIVKLEDRLYYVLQPPLESVFTGGTLDFPFTPFPYQFEGIAFLYPRFAAILADEMGLGKTMQAITTIRLLLHAGEVRSVLMVCPKPLVTNWQREFATWAPELPITIIEGDQAKRRWQWSQTESPIKIANYEVVVRDREMIEDPELKFDLCVLDESQRIKNRNGTTAEVVCSIHRTRSWALTGTPVENCADDLVGIFEFLQPGYLTPGMKPRAMGKLAADYIIRRTKDKVLTELPPKMFRDVEIELTTHQRETYRIAEEEGTVRLTDMGPGATIQNVFELVMRLKQICNFDSFTGESAKLERLEADLEEVVANGRKALIFSQWVDTLERLGERLAHLNPLYYHGKIPHKKRDGVIQEFKQSKDRHVLLMSYGAGSVGLNLQFSQYVFLYDRWWNPAIEDQAINRAHRIGAAGPVTVTRFIAADTIEQRIDQLLRDKRELFDTIFSDAEPTAVNAGLTHDEIFGLFKLRSPQGPIKFAA